MGFGGVLSEKTGILFFFLTLCQTEAMLGMSTRGSTNTNQLQINIPDELKGVELQIIILPAGKENEQIDFFSQEELQQLPNTYLGNPIDDNEDYSKW
jgi:hypothetical protein